MLRRDSTQEGLVIKGYRMRKEGLVHFKVAQCPVHIPEGWGRQSGESGFDILRQLTRVGQL